MHRIANTKTNYVYVGFNQADDVSISSYHILLSIYTHVQGLIRGNFARGIMEQLNDQ